MKKVLPIFVFIILCAIAAPLFARAAAKPLSYAAWVPYWKKAGGSAEALAHLNSLNELSPFSYEVKPDGTITDTMKINNDPWPVLLAAARTAKVKIIPTISWVNGDQIQATLVSSSARTAHINAIVSIVASSGFDGIDIDYENKKAETNLPFALFIKALSIALHDKGKVLSCTIEPRTPLADRFVKPPKTIEYANDYVTINRRCDSVRILTYGQSTIDLQLNRAKGGTTVYAPVADDVWVKKVLAETTKTIKPGIIMLGVPTFGYEYELTKSGKLYQYKKLRSVTYKQATDLTASVAATPVRNIAGELSFTYQQATSTRLVWYADAAVVVDKVALAKRYGLRGVAVFKIDGEDDTVLWKALK